MGTFIVKTQEVTRVVAHGVFDKHRSALSPSHRLTGRPEEIPLEGKKSGAFAWIGTFELQDC